jgi:hypothetical protein
VWAFPRARGVELREPIRAGRRGAESSGSETFVIGEIIWLIDLYVINSIYFAYFKGRSHRSL